MGKYEVKFSCGHTETIQLFGKVSERERKIEYFEQWGQCSECYEKQKAEGCREIEMPYREYKNKYSECNTKRDSYDQNKKTIIVYLPNEVEYQTEEPKESEWKQIGVNANNIKVDTGKSTRVGMPKKSEYSGYDFWHPSKLVRNHREREWFMSISYTKDWEFVLKKYGRGRHNQTVIIDEITIGVDEFEEAFKDINDHACSWFEPMVDPYETHKPPHLEAEKAVVPEELRDE